MESEPCGVDVTNVVQQSSMTTLTAACHIPLSRGLVALVDPADYERVSQYKWYAMPHGHTFYAARTENRRTILMHFFIVGQEPGKETDHWDHDGLNNRRYNLRIVTHAENMANCRPGSKWHPGDIEPRPYTARKVRKGKTLKGVSKRKNANRWEAKIRTNGRIIYLGLHKTPEDAARAYDAAALAHFGDKAVLNFPAALP